MDENTIEKIEIGIYKDNKLKELKKKFDEVNKIIQDVKVGDIEDYQESIKSRNIMLDELLVLNKKIQQILYLFRNEPFFICEKCGEGHFMFENEKKI